MRKYQSDFALLLGSPTTSSPFFFFLWWFEASVEIDRDHTGKKRWFTLQKKIKITESLDTEHTTVKMNQVTFRNHWWTFTPFISRSSCETVPTQSCPTLRFICDERRGKFTFITATSYHFWTSDGGGRVEALIDAGIIYTVLNNAFKLWTLDKKILNFLDKEYLFLDYQL